MRYVSPAWLFNGQLPGKFDPKAIRLRRTQLLADLELTGITIEYRGQTLTKNDIIVLFDELETENALPWHIAIAQDKTLLTFLEDLHFDDAAVSAHCVCYLNNPLYQDEAFIRWLSPYYYEPFMFYMELNCLKTSNLNALTALLGVPLLMTPADQEKAWKATIRLIEKPIDHILHYAEKAVTEAELAKAGRWMEEGFLGLVRLLPETHFGPLRDRYALAIFKACENVRRKDPKYPVQTNSWMHNAVGLAHSAKIKNQLIARQKKALSLSEHVRRIKRIPLRIWIMIIIGLLLCFWIGRHRH